VPEFESTITQRKIDIAKCNKNQSSPFRVLHVKRYYDTYTNLYDTRNLKKCRKTIDGELLKIAQKRFRKHLEQFILS